MVFIFLQTKLFTIATRVRNIYIYKFKYIISLPKFTAKHEFIWLRTPNLYSKKDCKKNRYRKISIFFICNLLQNEKTFFNFNFLINK